MPIWLIVIMCVLGGLSLTLVSLKLMQILQLSSYRMSGVFAWVKRTKFDYAVRYFALSFFCFVSMFVYVACFKNAGGYSYLGFGFFVVLCCAFGIAISRQNQKTPLKYTKRIFRLILVDFIVNGGLLFALIWLMRNTAVTYSLIGVTPLLSPFALMIAHYIVMPIEKLIAKSYLKKASDKLRAASPMVIGITGSYGKTTAKNVLSRFLGAKYKVFASPASYNTPMGLSKCINEDYKDEEIFIAEMGARYAGDIKQLKEAFDPQYAMLTSIGNQHLETFGSKQNIITEKLSILNGVKFAVANGDCPEIVDGAKGKAELCSAECCYNVKTDILGTSFTLKLGEAEMDINTRLVGEHIPVTIAMCARLAMKLGVSPDAIKEAAENLPFVEHRLEVLNSGDIIILDDSYNSNPRGANNAMDILATFDGTKVIITPGFVELGEDSDECLKALGQKIASICDYAFLLGPNAEVIKSGMGDFQKVFLVGSLDEAMESLKAIVPPMAVLFENDLPDNY